jgi:hypothetical protein
MPCSDCESAHNIDLMDMKSIKRLECRSAPGPHAETQSISIKRSAPKYALISAIGPWRATPALARP